jgi:hypothetical protein
VELQEGGLIAELDAEVAARHAFAGKTSVEKTAL